MFENMAILRRFDKCLYRLREGAQKAKVSAIRDRPQFIHYVFKEVVQKLAYKLGVTVRIAHYPAYCS